MSTYQEVKQIALSVTGAGVPVTGPVTVTNEPATDLDVDLVGLNGVAPDVGDGTLSSGTQRITIATDDINIAQQTTNLQSIDGKIPRSLGDRRVAIGDPLDAYQLYGNKRAISTSTIDSCIAGYTGANYLRFGSASQLALTSSNAADTSDVIVIYVDDTGIRYRETLTLNGQTDVLSTRTDITAVHSMVATDSAAQNGDVYFRRTAGTQTAGVPDNLNFNYGFIAAQEGVMQQVHYRPTSSQRLLPGLLTVTSNGAGKFGLYCAGVSGASFPGAGKIFEIPIAAGTSTHDFSGLALTGCHLFTRCMSDAGTIAVSFSLPLLKDDTGAITDI